MSISLDGPLWLHDCDQRVSVPYLIMRDAVELRGAVGLIFRVVACGLVFGVEVYQGVQRGEVGRHGRPR